MHSASPITTKDRHRQTPPADLRVVLDMDADHPITEEELDILEAFLFQEIQALLKDDDSKQPQIQASLATIS
ncbi:hypothetical protein AB3G45_11375 [Shinella sp. S4-D37]|uniref:hypothetical protein n=1 Tax=Shinella sp. S4-D37 TaxID=3161999 RepID=UPI0034670CF6